MNKEEYLNKLYYVSFSSGMNQRYHQYLASRWNWWDRGFKISTGLLATAGCIAAFATDWPLWLRQAIASLAAVLAIARNVLPFGEWGKIHSDIFRRWSDLL